MTIGNLYIKALNRMLTLEEAKMVGDIKKISKTLHNIDDVDEDFLKICSLPVTTSYNSYILVSKTGKRVASLSWMAKELNKSIRKLTQQAKLDGYEVKYDRSRTYDDSYVHTYIELKD